MSAIEEMVAVRVAPSQAMRVLTTVARFQEWVGPGVTVLPLTGSPTLLPGDRFRLEVFGTVSFEYTVEAATDREVVLSFRGPWSGEERWSFIADGAETIVRRRYDVARAAGFGMLAWETVGRAAALAQLTLELSRFRDAAERSPGPRAEIDAGRPTRETPLSDGAPHETPLSATPPYPIDEG